MHILIALIAAIGGAFWAFRYFVNAADQGREAVGDAKAALRRGKWSRQIDAQLINNISDPRESAAIMMVQIAAYDGDVTQAQKEKMTDLMEDVFQISNEEAIGFYSFGRMAIGQINDAGNSLRKLTKPILENCTMEERQSFVSMVQQVAMVEGPETDVQKQFLQSLERHLLA